MPSLPSARRLTSQSAPRDLRPAAPLASRDKSAAPARRSAAVQWAATVPRALRTPTKLEEFRERVYALIRRIPRGKVATYGQIAALAGYPRQARRVGQALGAPHSPADLPWQRVINAQGRVSSRAPRPERAIGSREAEQERLLRREGVRFVNSTTDLERYRWRPRS